MGCIPFFRGPQHCKKPVDPLLNSEKRGDTYITEFYRALFMKKTTVVTIEGRSLRERQVREGTHAHKSSDFVRTIRSHTDAPITVIKHANKHKQVKALKY